MRLLKIAAAIALTAAGGGVASAQPSQPAALGVQLNDMEKPGAILVHKVMPGLTAEALGLKVGDELLEINGIKPADADAVVTFMQGVKAGDPLNLVIRRDGKSLQLGGKAAGRPAGMATGRLRMNGDEAVPEGSTN